MLVNEAKKIYTLAYLKVVTVTEITYLKKYA